MSTSALRLDVVLPIFNEAGTLAASVRALHATMEELMDFPHWQITIADNASTDESAAIAIQLADDLPRIRLVLLPEKGRGGALKEAWLTSKADVVAKCLIEDVLHYLADSPGEIDA